MIFYADDDADDLDFFRQISVDLGRKLLTFSSGDELMQQLKNPPPFAGIVFLDINMPKKSGLEVLREIRASPLWKKLPVVMLSTSSHHAQVEKCFNAGANMYIAKSPQYQALKESIQMALSMDWNQFKPVYSDFLYKG